jgi:dTDP-L-rhamnose 4-epimerase
MKVLLTGAGGFIGTAVDRELTARGHHVTGIDAFIAQAHGGTAATAAEGVRRIDIRDGDAVHDALVGVDVVCHQAAMVGAGVATADLPLYASHNDLGTAVVLAEMAACGVDRLVLASSMVVYGDGRYACPTHDEQQPRRRRRAELAEGRFEMLCPHCDQPMRWVLVDEDSSLRPRSSYAASKVAQEHYASAWAGQASAAVVALRYHNVYGPGMPRDTPYSGVAAIFRSAVEKGEAPRVFEDGAQMRDFVHVDDVATANALAIEEVTRLAPESFEAYNVCSGVPVSIAEVATSVARGYSDASDGSGGLEPVTTGDFRAGDVRHIVASPRRAADRLGFTAAVDPTTGLAEFATAPLRGSPAA